MKLCIISFSPVFKYPISEIPKSFTAYALFTKFHDMTISLYPGVEGFMCHITGGSVGFPRHTKYKTLGITA